MSQFPHFPWGYRFQRKRERNPTSAVIRDGNKTEPKLAVLSKVDVTAKQVPHAEGIFIARGIYRIAIVKSLKRDSQEHLKSEGAEPLTEGAEASAPAQAASGTESLGGKSPLGLQPQASSWKTREGLMSPAVLAAGE